MVRSKPLYCPINNSIHSTESYSMLKTVPNNRSDDDDNNDCISP
jgi:hypothetical protein